MRFGFRSALLSALMVSTVMAAPGVHAADVVFAVATDAAGRPIALGALPVGQEIATSGGTMQLRLDGGSMVSFVGPCRFSIGRRRPIRPCWRPRSPWCPRAGR